MVNIALLGFGTVGSGTAEVIKENRQLIEKHISEEINIKYILDLRDFPDSEFAGLIIHDFNTILNDPEVSIVVEMLGGSHPAYDFTKAALMKGKSVVTSNKECVAGYGCELLDIATENGCRYLFEAAVGGGIPIIRPLTDALAPVRINSISGILNGTTNYILTEMATKQADFSAALSEAQEKGYAERDPKADVEGYDAARKIVILAAMASGVLIDPDSIHREGITGIKSADIEIAESFDCSVKLIGKYEVTENGKIAVSVCPYFVPKSDPLHSVSGVFNGIKVDTDILGEVMFYGKGAGKLPTAGAVVSDIVDIASSENRVNALRWRKAENEDIADFSVQPYNRVISLGNTDINTVKESFGKIYSYIIDHETVSFVTEKLTDKEVCEKLSVCPAVLISEYRLLK